MAFRNKSLAGSPVWLSKPMTAIEFSISPAPFADKEAPSKTSGDHQTEEDERRDEKTLEARGI